MRLSDMFRRDLILAVPMAQITRRIIIIVYYATQAAQRLCCVSIIKKTRYGTTATIEIVIDETRTKPGQHTDL